MAIATRANIINNLAAGKSTTVHVATTATGAPTAAAFNSGNFTCQPLMTTPLTTYPGTLVGIQTPPASNELLLTHMSISNGSGRGGWLGYFYLLGTVNLAATGDQFTHAAGVTFPVLRTRFGVASQAKSLWPIIYMTTASSTTAPAFVLKTAGGGAGYVNQAGSNVVGTKTFTLPSSTTGQQSGYVLRLEDGDTGVQDISAIQVTSAGATGAATVYGFEPLLPIFDGATAVPFSIDTAFALPILPNIAPAVATSGTLTSYLGCLILGTGAIAAGSITVTAVNNV